MSVAQGLASARSFTWRAITAGSAGRQHRHYRRAPAARVILLLG